MNTLLMKLIYLIIIIVLVLASAASILIAKKLENFGETIPRTPQRYTAGGNITRSSARASGGTGANRDAGDVSSSSGSAGARSGGGRQSDTADSMSGSVSRAPSVTNSRGAEIRQAIIAPENSDLAESCLRDYQDCLTNRFHNKPEEYNDYPEVW